MSQTTVFCDDEDEDNFFFHKSAQTAVSRVQVYYFLEARIYVGRFQPYIKYSAIFQLMGTKLPSIISEPSPDPYELDLLNSLVALIIFGFESNFKPKWTRDRTELDPVSRPMAMMAHIMAQEN
jgi:hypothetical protein